MILGLKSVSFNVRDLSVPVYRNMAAKPFKTCMKPLNHKNCEFFSHSKQDGDYFTFVKSVVQPDWSEQSEFAHHDKRNNASEENGAIMAPKHKIGI